MPPRTPIALLIAACVATFAACAGQSPAEPTTFALPAGLGAKVEASPGVYNLSFWGRVGPTWQVVSTLPVRTGELVIRADVTDASGTPAAEGTVVFEYCSYKKRPPNDITRADEAPKEACETGTASWARLASVSIADGGNCLALGGGSACTWFGIVRIPRTVGFRYRFSGPRSGIAGGMSAAFNFTWVPES
jgi:hypothetical protein